MNKKYLGVSIQFFLLGYQAICVSCALVTSQFKVIIDTGTIYSQRKLKQLWKHAPTTRGARAVTNSSNFITVFSAVF